MAVYFVTGKLGSGKTLCTVGKIKDYLEQGRRVATNLDLYLEKMLPEYSKQTVIRLPDKPRLEDLDALGQGCEEENEDRYGLLVLDELGTWFNSRNWRDKERLPVIDWFLHARKHHWDIFFIVQDIESIDGQLINALCEHLVICSRTDRLNIPFIGPMLKWIGFNKVMPKIHVASVYYGMNKQALRVDRWIYRAKNLYAAYNTAQKFKDDLLVLPGGEVVDWRAPYSLLTSYHLNHVALRKVLQKELDLLSPGRKTRTVRQDRPHFFARVPMSQVAAVAGCAILSVWEFSRSPGEAHATAAPIPANNQPITTQQPVMTAESEEKTEPQKDFFQKMTDGSMVKVSSFYSDGFTLRAILQVSRQDEKSLITLGDARALGYVATVSNKILNIAKPGYSLQLRLP